MQFTMQNLKNKIIRDKEMKKGRGRASRAAETFEKIKR